MQELLKVQYMKVKKIVSNTNLLVPSLTFLSKPQTQNIKLLKRKSKTFSYFLLLPPIPELVGIGLTLGGGM